MQLRILLSIFATFWLSACSAVAPSPPITGEEGQNTPIALGVGFIPSVQFAPLYVGLKNGYFEEEGIELSIEYGFENDYLKLVGTGEYSFLIGSGEQVVLGRAQDLPVVYVFNWYTRFPVTIFAKADRGIAEPADLRGKTVGIPGPFGATYIALLALLDSAGLSETDIQTQSIGFTQSAAVSEDLVDAAVDYAVNGPLVLRAAGIEVSQIDLDPYFQIPANGLITNERTIEENPDLVAAMIRAFQRSVEATLADPDAGFQIALEFVPEAGGENEAINRAIFDASLSYWQPKTDGRVVGATSAQEWEAVAELMERLGFVDVDLDPELLYTNRFVE